MGNPVKGLIPGDTREFPCTSCAYTFEWVLKPIWGIEPLTIGTPSCTGPELGLLAIIGLNPGYDPVFDMDFKQACAAAVVRTAADDYFCFAV
jgi:hypothetical protein